MTRLKLLYRRCKRILMLRVLHADDTPERIALGVAIGVFVAFTPFYGFQIVLAVALAWLLGGNKLVSLIPVWITNPLTLVPIYYWCYSIGASFLGQAIDTTVRTEANKALTALVQGQWWDSIEAFWNVFGDVGWSLFVGSTIVGILTSLPSYLVTVYIVRWYRMKKFGQYNVPHSHIHKHCKKI